MAFQESVAARNAKLNTFNTTLGASAVLKIFSGAEPANCAAADPAGLLATVTLPASPFASASAGAVALAGSWAGTGGGAGNAASYRIYDGSAVCHMQGAVTATGGGGDL